MSVKVVYGFSAVAVAILLAVILSILIVGEDEPAIDLEVSSQVNRATYMVAGVQGSVFHGQILRPLLREAYEKIGIQITYKEFPALRALDMANSQFDAEVGRTPAYIKQYDQLETVPVNLMDFNLNVYSHDPNIRIRSFDDLQQYVIARRRGVKLLDIKLAEHPNCIVVESTDQIIELLSIGRIDLVIGVEVDFEYAVKSLLDEGRHVDKIYVHTVLSNPIHHPIHKRNADLIPDLSKALQDMVDQGRFAQRMDEFMAGVRNTVVRLPNN